MKILEPIKINITDAKSRFGEAISVNDIKADLEMEGAVVRGYTDGSSIVMEISGDIELDQIEMVFEEAGMPGIDEFIIDDLSYDEEEFEEAEDMVDESDEFIPECNESKKVRFSSALIEQFNSKNTPVKKSKKMVNLAEALGHTYTKSVKPMTLDEVIDDMIGCSLTESIAEKAIAKAKDAKAKKLEDFEKNLGTKRCFRILESLRNESPFMYPDVKINGIRVAEYTINQLKGLQEKLNVQISELERKISLNEGDTTLLEKELENKKKLQTMLEDELTYRLAFEHNVNEDEEKTPVEKELVDAPKSEEEKSEDSDEEVEVPEEELNPDKDEETEVSNIVITLANKDAAESLKSDLVAAGIPEDVILIELVKDEEAEDEEVAEDDAEETEEEKKTEESVNSNGFALNEDEEADADVDAETEEKSEEDAEESVEVEESEEEAVKLILKDTDYVETLVNVLEDTWGLEREEFEKMIGGEIVAETEDDEEESEEEAEESVDDDDDFNPDEIFKDL